MGPVQSSLLGHRGPFEFGEGFVGCNGLGYKVKGRERENKMGRWSLSVRLPTKKSEREGMSDGEISI